MTKTTLGILSLVAGAAFAQGGDMAVVESAKAASDVYAPVSGEVTAVNDVLSGQPDLVNQSPDGEGWFVKLKVANKAEVEALMDEEIQTLRHDKLKAYQAAMTSVGLPAPDRPTTPTSPNPRSPTRTIAWGRRNASVGTAT